MRHLVAWSGVTLVLLWAGTAVAGDYHVGTSLVCADCHVMHFSQSHGYNDDGTGISTPMGGAGPYEYLLRNEVNDLCLTCHDNQAFAPDVFEENSNGYVREAGALNDEGSAGSYHPANGHTLGSHDVAPGGTWTSEHGLECASCHAVHGSTTGFRNLNHRIITGLVSPTYAVGTNDLTKDIYETSARSYSVDDVWFNEPNSTGSAMATWCKACHTDFHGAKGGPEVGGATGEEWLRHPNADANIGALGGGHSSLSVYNGRTNKTKVMSPTGVWGPTVPGDVTPFCLSCHKGHGNQNSFGLVFMSGTGAVTEEGDTDGVAAKNTCKQCHRQGG